MTPDVQSTDLQQLLAGRRVWYEFRPYNVVVDQRPAGLPPVHKKVQAGFDVNLYAVLENERFGLDRRQESRVVRSYFGSLAKEIQTQVGQHCTVEIMPYRDSVILDTHEHFQPQAMLQIRISHGRGLDQPFGPAEEQALNILKDRLHDLGIAQK
jgi:hypothetical protein